MTQRILFVDDDPMVLRGLQRSLFSLRHEWEMVFVESGPAALEAIDRTPFDAVVSDMRMPQMNGAELLNEVLRRHPGTARLVLSGHADKDLILQCVTAAHQFLTKPCDPEVLKDALRRALGDGEDAGCRALLAKVSDLPILPARYLELKTLLEDPGLALASLTRVVERDTGLASRLLKLTNNAFFGLRRKVSSIEESIHILGVETLKALVRQQGFMDQCPKQLPEVLDLASWSDRSLRIAQLARTLAEDLTPGMQDLAFGAGLLHKAGLVVMCAAEPDVMTDLLESRDETARPLWTREREAIGVDHAQVGAYLLGLWCLPEELVEAVRYHLYPSQTPRRSGILAALHGACATLSGLAGFDGRPWHLVPDRAYLEAFSTPHPFPEWRRVYMSQEPT